MMGKSEVTCDNYRRAMNRDIPLYDVDDRCCFLCGWNEATIGSNDNVNEWDDEQVSLLEQCTRNQSGALERCSDCDLVWYCSQDHLQIHRINGRCFPFVIKKTKDKGRFMVAARDINPLELILIEEPAVVGPYSKSSIGCLQCFKKVDGTYRCRRCQFPMCGDVCASGRLHETECKFFEMRNSQAKAIGNKDEITRYDGCYICITPLRMLLKRDDDPKAFAKINMLMDHVEDRSETTASSGTQQLFKLVLLLKDESLPCNSNFSYKDIQRMIGILRTNGMKLESHGDRGCPGVALYPVYCLINHACFNNTNYVKFPDLHLELRSQLPISKGEEIFTRYISSTIGNIRRREDIVKHWFFDCECYRCSDITEMGTFMSAVRCLGCQNGYLLPQKALSYQSLWECDTCHDTLPHETVDEVIGTIEEQITSLENGDIEKLEEMLFHYQKLLHPNHYILIDLMHNLVHLYAAKEVLTRPEKERKVQLCLIVIDILGRVDPGFTKWRGTLLQELIHTLMIVSKEDHVSNQISEREFEKRLSFCSRKLREAKLCLYGGFTPIEEYLQEKETNNKTSP